MSVSTALKKAREAKNLKQEAVGQEIYLSAKMISAIERGRRKLPKDASPKVATMLDDPELYAALQAQATGGVASPWLDGDRVDLHRSSVRDKTIEELSEAIEALSKARMLVNAKDASDLDADGLKQIKEALHQLVEAQTACQVAIGVLCKQYNLSMAQVYRDHISELITKGYVRKENAA